MPSENLPLIDRNRIFAWIALATALLLLVPLVAMQFTKEVQWTLLDFIVMAALLSGIGSAFVIVARRISPKLRLPIGIAFAVAFLYIWAELAVGIFTNIGA